MFVVVLKILLFPFKFISIRFFVFYFNLLTTCFMLALQLGALQDIVVESCYWIIIVATYLAIEVAQSLSTNIWILCYYCSNFHIRSIPPSKG